MSFLPSHQFDANDKIKILYLFLYKDKNKIVSKAPLSAYISIAMVYKIEGGIANG